MLKRNPFRFSLIFYKTQGLRAKANVKICDFFISKRCYSLFVMVRIRSLCGKSSYVRAVSFLLCRLNIGGTYVTHRKRAGKAGHLQHGCCS